MVIIHTIFAMSRNTENEMVVFMLVVTNFKIFAPGITNRAQSCIFCRFSYYHINYPENYPSKISLTNRVSLTFKKAAMLIHTTNSNACTQSSIPSD